MSGEVEKCPILHVCPKFDVFTLIRETECRKPHKNSKKKLGYEGFKI